MLYVSGGRIWGTSVDRIVVMSSSVMSSVHSSSNSIIIFVPRSVQVEALTSRITVALKLQLRGGF